MAIQEIIYTVVEDRPDSFVDSDNPESRWRKLSNVLGDENLVPKELTDQAYLLAVYNFRELRGKAGEDDSVFDKFPYKGDRSRLERLQRQLAVIAKKTPIPSPDINSINPSAFASGGEIRLGEFIQDYVQRR